MQACTNNHSDNDKKQNSHIDIHIDMHIDMHTDIHIDMHINIHPRWICHRRDRKPTTRPAASPAADTREAEKGRLSTPRPRGWRALEGRRQSKAEAKGNCRHAC